MTQNQRVFTPYEQTLLARAGLSHLTPEDVGHQPIEYVVGWVEFCGLKFKVNPTVLIPRIETEWLVELVVKTAQTKINLLQPGEKITVADIGTGSGAIGISLLHQLNVSQEKIQLFISDISPEALQVAQTNAQSLIPKANIQIFQSDLLSNFLKDQPIDILMANLPYIPSGRIERLDSSVKDYEPKLALDGGEDGLKLISKLLEQASQYLTKDGVIWLEIDASHTLQELKTIAPQYQVKIIQDNRQYNRFAKIEIE
ncbi:peptide chain release factor N(5)-glutamine methyltransferase [Patescibacteria group bacterium]|nr:peptide chain release factor N(5)-glutamine methyltransferase [Patescibacteria group bacterium]